MSRVANDPQDWANKRKAAVERAKQLREERKNGGGNNNDNATFQPQINKRPSYLDKDRQDDTLDRIASNNNNNYRPDDIFEKPLPGTKKYDYNKIPSPSSDALGKEMKKFNYDEQQGGSSSNNGYKSKFMQQYDNDDNDIHKPANSAGSRFTNEKQEHDSDERFMSMLRSDDQRRSSKPGWNDDIQTGNLFEAPQKQGKAKVSVSNIKGKNARESAPEAPRRRPLQSQVENQKEQWSDDYSDNYTVPAPSFRELPSSKQTQENAYSKSPRINPDHAPLNQARSRLSLLKSKMRSSESSGGSRGGDMHSSSSTSINTNEEYPIKRENRANTRTAPLPVDNRDHGRRGGVKSKPMEDFDSDMVYPSYNGREEVDDHHKPKSQFLNDLPPDAIADIGELIECPDCGRKFNSGPYEKHVKICAKVFMKKRKVFDSQKHRIADNPELVKILKQKQTRGPPAKKPPSGADVRSNDKRTAGISRQNVEEESNVKSSKWKQQSQAFREAMKSARQVTQAIATGAPLPPPKISAPDPSLIPCPHCGRRFNEKAGERHIPQCKNIKAQPSRLSKGGGISAAVGSKMVANGYKSHTRGTF